MIRIQGGARTRDGSVGPMTELLINHRELTGHPEVSNTQSEEGLSK